MAKCNFETGHRPIDKIELLAREVLDGKHGNGEERRKNLDWLIEEEEKKCTEQ